MAINRFKIFLSGLFFIYLVADGFKNHLSFYLGGILALGFFTEWYYNRNPKYIREITLSSIPPQENKIFQLLGNLMRSHSLEMRLRRAEFLWNVTFIKTESSIVRMMGRGTAPSISEAIMRAEGDFEKRNLQ